MEGLTARERALLYAARTLYDDAVMFFDYTKRHDDKTGRDWVGEYEEEFEQLRAFLDQFIGHYAGIENVAAEMP